MNNYLALTKPRITGLVVVTTLVGFLLASERPVDWSRLLWTSLGVALASAATGCLNQVMEIKEDSLMRRTRGRPLPQGNVESGPASAFGLVCATLGGLVLIWRVNGISCLLTAFTLLSYLLIYTPLKRKTSLATWIGAVPGAIPPLIGWAAARGTLGPTAWVLYAIQFLWQIPHFLALSWIYKEDYARAGFRVPSLADSSGFSIAWQMGATSSVLVLISLLPYALGLVGAGYLAGALALGAISMAVGLRPLWGISEKSARQVFLASLVYLPSIYSLLLAAAK
ncbi:MAG: protoheme IX farnesyltransferase [Elusimicrobia bacterium]|nr:protoheme IX farnesyltransferase [Elusimicrobiota bacterium]